MFSTGQIIFAILFIIVFAIALGYAYKGDRKLHTKNYKGVKWIAIAFILFICTLYALKHVLR
ncbi:hypothetical protein [Aurantibacter sp.]|uniref:hypothetical protein n=1 Tax=Aurantibacter sp. TaxID=2807103 RepID=UPI003264621B